MLAVVLPTAHPAGSEPGVREQLEHETRRLEEVREKHEQAKRKIRVLSSRRTVLETQLSLNRSERSGLERQIEDLRRDAETARKGIEASTRELGEAETRYRDYLADFESRMVHIYKRSTLSPLAALAQSRSVEELVMRTRYFLFLEEDALQLTGLQAIRDEVERKRTGLEKARNDAERLRAELAGRERGLALNIQEQTGLLESIRREREHEVAKSGKLLEASRMLETRIGNLGRAARVVEEERTRPPRPAPKKLGKGDLAWPLDGDISIARPFGRAVNETGTPEFNSGLDLQVDGPTQVKAAADGKVLFQGVFSPVYGKVVMLDHGGTPVNIISLYGNLDTILVAQGQEVRTGDTLGMVGTEPQRGSPPPVLHFEVRRGTEAQDPREWIATR